MKTTLRKFSRCVYFGSAIACIVSCLVGIIMLLIQVYSLQHTVYEARDTVRKIEGQVLEEKFTIVYPTTDSVVDRETYVRGHIPFDRRHVYLIITPIDGRPELQQGEISISDHEWKIKADFGSAAAGEGKLYSIKAIATNGDMDPAAPTNLPADAVVSAEVIVKRRPT